MQNIIRYLLDSFSGLEKYISVRKRSLLTLGIRPFHTSFIYFYFLRPLNFVFLAIYLSENVIINEKPRSLIVF